MQMNTNSRCVQHVRVPNYTVRTVVCQCHQIQGIRMKNERKLIINIKYAPVVRCAFASPCAPQFHMYVHVFISVSNCEHNNETNKITTPKISHYKSLVISRPRICV